MKMTNRIFRSAAAVLFLIFAVISATGNSQAAGASELVGEWAFDHDPKTAVLKMEADGYVWYRGKDYTWTDDQDGFLHLTDTEGTVMLLRYQITEDQKIIYPRTSYHRGKEVDGQKGLIGVWEGIEDGSSFVFTPAGYFLEDSVFAGNYMADSVRGVFLLHYGDVFADTLCYYSIEDEILTVEYPWTLVEKQT